MLIDMDGVSVITVTDLKRSYGGSNGRSFEAVRGVTLSVRRGEFFAVLGTNGAGKTSTMEVLEGLTPPGSGIVRVLGCDPYRQRSQVRRRMGIMLQEGGFPSELTVAETGRMWAGTLSTPRPVDEALELVDLSRRSSVRVKSLSGGERRRLDLAMAILGRPEVLFLDEPTTGLDPESRRRTWSLIRELQSDGTTIVLTTHYLEEAEELADRCAIMHEGKIVRMGTTAEVASSEPARISFELPENALVSMPGLPGARSSQTGRKIVLHTHEMQRTLTMLLEWANSSNLVLGHLDASSTSLEAAFLAAASCHPEPAHTELPDDPEDPGRTSRSPLAAPTAHLAGGAFSRLSAGQPSTTGSGKQ
jgi:ABC-2 type transport system ATP-binding protein